MEEKLHETDKIEDLMMPGFRFHPTDEELVGFYLKRKIQQRQLPVELIKQVDIYKYDPWDLPKLASSTGEKEWYFYCPRDRKYRNSVRPNRVTGAGFWKATGTDRPIYSSDGSKCIGLKKSLVFYRGRAAKGLKTDWMMHEFRLPSSSSSSVPPANTPKKILDKSLPPNDAWAICRIFKKANSNAQRALAHAWLIPLPDPSSSEMLSQGVVLNNQPFSSETVSYNTDMESNMQQWDNNNLQHNSCTTGSDINIVSSQHLNTMDYKPSFLGDLLPENFMLSQQDISELTNNYTLDSAASVLHTITGDSVSSENIFGYSQQNYNDFSIDSSPEIEEVGLLKRQRISNVVITSDHHQLSEEITTVGFPFSLPSNLGNAWKKPHLSWGPPNCPSELSTSKCYT